MHAMRSAISTIATAVALSAVVSAQNPRDYLSWKGEQPDERFGVSIANLGDVNGDTYDDYVIGEDGISTVHVVSGKDGRKIREHTEPGFLGWSVDGAGDVDGDGVPDVLACAPSASPGGRQGAGSAFIWSGKDGSLLWRIDGDAGRDGLGRVGVGLGDVNFDGHADVAVSAAFAANGTAIRAGLVRIVSGKDGTVIRDIRGTVSGQLLGMTLGTVGDVGPDVGGQPDGFADLLIGNPWDGGTGFADIYSGNWIATGSGSPFLYQYVGPAQDDDFGFPGGSRGIGDIDQDGFADYAIAAPQSQPKGKGYVNLYTGRTGTLIRTIDGKVDDELFGNSIAIVGDVNNDAWPDIAIASSGADNKNGHDTGKVAVYSGIWLWQQVGDEILLTVEGDGPYRSVFGSSVAPAGDANGDGVPDILVTELWNPGRVVVVSGVPLDFTASCHQIRVGQFNRVDYASFIGDATNWRTYWQQDYWVFMSASGTSPGVALGGVTIPLNPDALTGLGMSLTNSPALVDFRGTTGATDVAGFLQASATSTLFTAPLSSSLLGTYIHLAALITDAATGAPLYATSPVSLEIVK